MTEGIILELIGAPGLVLLILAFYLNVTKRVKRLSFEYNGLNLVGSSVLVCYSYLINAPVFIVLESVWAAVAAWFLVKKTFNIK